MKQEIHPDYHKITIVMTNGTAYETRSTYGKEGDTMRLDVDPVTHPAWNGGAQQISSGGQLARFNKRFQSFGLEAAPGEKKAEKTDEKVDEKVAEKKTEKKAKK